MQQKAISITVLNNYKELMVKKIVFVIHGLPVGGAEKFLITLVNHLPPKAFEPHIILLSKDETLKHELNSNVYVHKVIKSSRFDFGISKRIKGLIDVISPEIVMCVNTYSFFLTKLGYSAKSPYRFILSPHTTIPFSIYNYLQSMVYYRKVRPNDLVLYLCNAQMRYINNTYKLPMHNKKVIYNGIDSAFYSPENISDNEVTSLLQSLNINSHEKIIVQVARIQKEKRHEDAIEALALLNKNRLSSKVHLLIVGGGDADKIAMLKDRVQRLGEQDHIHFLGNRHDVRLYYKAASIFTLTSESETFSLAALEAMAFGLPVVLTNVGGAAEMVTEYQNGFLVPPKNPEKIAAAWNKALLHSFDSTVIRKQVVNNFSIDQMVNNYLQIFSARPNQSIRSKISIS
jgi:glycosyltransferase involved in cell wall biosynthesis